MLIVGLTGPIASGKSRIIDIFKSCNVPVCSDDDLIDKLYRDKKVIKHLQETFNIDVEDAFYPKIKSAVFDKVRQSGSFKELENCLYPLLWKKRFGFLLKAFLNNPRCICVLEIPLLIEKKLHELCDYVIVVNCAFDVRKERAMLRPTMTIERLNFVDKNQIDVNDKLYFADFVVDTSRDINSVTKRVKSIYEELTKVQNNIDFLNILNWRKYNEKNSI